MVGLLHHSQLSWRKCDHDSPHTHAEYHFLCRYATSKLAVQNISDCQYVAAMNPTAGSFQVNIEDYYHYRLACGVGWIQAPSIVEIPSAILVAANSQTN